MVNYSRDHVCVGKKKSGVKLDSKDATNLDTCTFAHEDNNYGESVMKQVLL